MQHLRALDHRPIAPDAVIEAFFAAEMAFSICLVELPWKDANLLPSEGLSTILAIHFLS